MKELVEQVKILQDKLDAMNKYYAQALSRTLITKEDLDLILTHIKDIRGKENEKSRRVNKRVTRKSKTKK